MTSEEIVRIINITEDQLAVSLRLTKEEIDHIVNIYYNLYGMTEEENV